MKSCVGGVLDRLSGQDILDRMGANGGDVVVLRTIVVGSELTLICVGLQAWLDPSLVGPITWNGFVGQVTDLGAVVGAIYAGTYAAFYTRFVSQWTYLAGLYNQIKQAEAARGRKAVIAQWKAAYIEDAETLHLMRKAIVAPVVKAWAADPAVVRAYDRYTPGGLARLEAILQAVTEVCAFEAVRRRPQ